jgi:hypothetical protein
MMTRKGSDRDLCCPMNAVFTKGAPECAPQNVTLGCITPEDLTGDIERVIRAIVIPYVDNSNPLMQEEELRAECRAKLARIIDANRLKDCPTRAKAFGFIKTAMKNHVRSLVQKFAFTQKRTGIKAPAKHLRFLSGTSAAQRKLTKFSLDDDDAALRVGGADPAFRRMDFLEELDFQLTPEERVVLAALIQDGDEETAPMMEDTVIRIKEKARALVGG